MPRMRQYRIDNDIPINGMTERQRKAARSQAKPRQRTQAPRPRPTGPAWYAVRVNVPVWVIIVLYIGILATWALTFLFLVLLSIGMVI